MFEVSNPINWLDAQSSCAIWGGDLASITTVRENNYLNTLIISSVGNYWIGLNDRDVEGMYTWIDGATVSYINWASTPSDDTNSNCVQINNAGNDIWESVSCDATLNAFLCKRDESNTIPQGLLIYVHYGAPIASYIAWSRFAGCEPELHAGRAGPRVRAEYYYQPAGFAGRVFLLRALGPHQARSRPAQYLIVLSL